MMIKIVLNDKRIFLVEDYQQIVQHYSITNTILVFHPDEKKVTDMVDVLLVSEVEHAICVGNPEKLLGLFKKAFRFVRAGGGVVFNNKNEILFIYRRKKWDMAKGKLNRGEEIEVCAKREVQEETGIRNLETVQFLTNTYHMYLENTMVLKETSWFLLYSEDTRLRPQANEGIQKVVWVHKNNVRYQLKNTYPAIHDIFRVLATIE